MTHDLTGGGSHSPASAEGKVWIVEGFVIVPRHNKINELTAKGILRDAKGV